VAISSKFFRNLKTLLAILWVAFLGYCSVYRVAFQVAIIGDKRLFLCIYWPSGDGKRTLRAHDRSGASDTGTTEDRAAMSTTQAEISEITITYLKTIK
jgi:hypothetical protein